MAPSKKPRITVGTRAGTMFGVIQRTQKSRLSTATKGFAEVTRPRGYKKTFVLNSTEHEILNAPKYKNINKFSFFQAHISQECYFPTHKC